MFESFWKSLDPTIQAAITAAVIAIVGAASALVVSALNAAKAKFEAAKQAAIQAEQISRGPVGPMLSGAEKMDLAVQKFRTGRYSAVPPSEAKRVIQKALPSALRESQPGLGTGEVDVSIDTPSTRPPKS